MWEHECHPKKTNDFRHSPWYKKIKAEGAGVRKRDLVTGQRRVGPSRDKRTVAVLSPNRESETASVVLFLDHSCKHVCVCVFFFLVRFSCCVIFENTKKYYCDPHTVRILRIIWFLTHICTL